MKKAGVIEWYNDNLEKDFGVIRTPDDETYFIHYTNFSDKPDKIEEGDVFVFEKGFEQGKQTAKWCHRPNSYEDLITVLGFLGKSAIIRLDKSTRHKKGTLLSVPRKPLNIVEAGLNQLLDDRSFSEIQGWLIQYAHDIVDSDKKMLVFHYCEVLDKCLSKRENGEAAFASIMRTLRDYLEQKLLFPIWKNRKNYWLGYEDGGDLPITEDLLWSSRDQLLPGDLPRIVNMDFGESLILRLTHDKLSSENILIDEISVYYSLLPSFKSETIAVEARELLNGYCVSLIEKEIRQKAKSLPLITSDLEFDGYQKLESLILTDLPDDAQSKLIEELRNMAAENCAPEYQLKFWIAGWGENWDWKFVKQLFEDTEDSKARLDALCKVEQLQLKEELMEVLLKENKWETAFNLLSAYVKMNNSLGYYFELHEHFLDKAFWEDKQGSHLVDFVTDKIKEYANPKDLTHFFFEKYSDEYDATYLLNHLTSFTFEELEFCFQSEKTDKDFIMAVLQQQMKIDQGKEMVSDILLLGKKYLLEDYIRELEIYAFKTISRKMYFELWTEEKTSFLPKEELRQCLKDEWADYEKVHVGLKAERLSSSDVEDLLWEYLSQQLPIEDRPTFYTTCYHIKLLGVVSPLDWQTRVQDYNNEFFQLILWFLGYTESFSFNLLKKKFIYFAPTDQPKVFRRLFYLKEKGKLTLDVNTLSEMARVSVDIYEASQRFHPDIPLDLSTDLIIKALESFASEGRFLSDGKLFKTIFENFYESKRQKFQIGEYFEACPGRYVPEFDWKTEGMIKKVRFGEGKFYFAIEFSPYFTGEVSVGRYGTRQRLHPNPSFEELKEEVKKFPIRKWNPSQKHWMIPYIHEKEVLAFAEKHKFFLQLDGNNYANNSHLAKFVWDEVPEGITFCEGRIAHKIDSVFKTKFWWCANRPCYQNCATHHSVEEWENYTLLDFCRILGFDLDEKRNKYGVFPNGIYYQFVSKINRFNRLLERLYCTECDSLLHPVESSNFAAHTVVRFHCIKTHCSEHHKAIYLNHCLNGNCRGIIDSRVSEQCSHGLYICPDCGSCCTNDMFKRRLENLEKTGGYIHAELKERVKLKDAHRDQGVYFCYKCRGLMKNTRSDSYECTNCGVVYDLAKFRYRSSYRKKRNGDSRNDDLPF
jgi:hypothetical protein